MSWADKRRGARASYLKGKRLFDVAAAFVGLVVLSLPLAIIAILVRSRLGWPVIFRQTRPGWHGRPFTMLKFRTLADTRDEVGQILPDSQRMTTLGAFLRSTSLDEIPELWNVLRGDMSLVGPRPLLERYTAFFTEREKVRFEVRPGITGWAQIRGRNFASWDARLSMDVWYVEHANFGLDLRILALTVSRIARRNGVVIDPESTMQNLDDERREKTES